MNFTNADNNQLDIIIKHEYDCSPSLLEGAVIEMLNRGLFDRIIAECIYYVMKDVKKVEQTHSIGLDDFLQIGRIEVLNALKLFNPSRKKNFMSFVYLKVKSELIKQIEFLEAQKRDNRKVSSYNQETSDGTEFIEFFTDKKLNVEKYVISKVTIEQLLQRVNKHQKQVLLYRMQGYTFKEIAHMLGRGNDRTMHQAYKLAVEKMRKGA